MDIPDRNIPNLSPKRMVENNYIKEKIRKSEDSIAQVPYPLVQLYCRILQRAGCPPFDNSPARNSKKENKVYRTGNGRYDRYSGQHNEALPSVFEQSFQSCHDQSNLPALLYKFKRT